MEAIGQLTGGVAHDFNNLLTVISGGLQMLERSRDPAHTQRLMDGMRQAVERGAGLTRQLLAFSRRQSLRPEPIALAPMVEKMRDLLDHSLRGDIRVETDFPSGLWPVEADPGKLQLALLNLCVNARLHEQRGSGRVLPIEDDAQVAMLVSDMIRELGYEVDHLADAATALERIGAAEGVDVILSDVMMPGGVSGIDLVNALRGRGIEVPFMLASGRADAVADDAASVGVELLAKPFTIADVAGALARALR
ncbi:response regulator [Sphingomonas sp.]|uniref:response regulator n=1 Tax=Sphingomonas sp. TaxID=28214 RepID=UPI0025DDE56E|nr:response regulator [Sphingomonas sp.]